MSRVRSTNTDHSYIRAAERCGWGKKKAREMMKLASRFCTSAGNMTPSPLQEYVAQKQYGSPSKRIKLYQGYIFVFCSTSTRCITVYPVPKEYLGESEKNNEYNVR